MKKIIPLLLLISHSIYGEEEDKFVLPPPPNDSIQSEVAPKFQRNPDYKGFLRLGEQNEESLRVSMINLIATPEKYDGKKVELFGIYSCINMIPFLFFNEECFKDMDISNAVALSGQFSDPERISSLVSKTVFEKKDILHVFAQGVFKFESDREIDLLAHPRLLELTFISE